MLFGFCLWLITLLLALTPISRGSSTAQLSTVWFYGYFSFLIVWSCFCSAIPFSKWISFKIYYGLYLLLFLRRSSWSLLPFGFAANDVPWPYKDVALENTIKMSCLNTIHLLHRFIVSSALRIIIDPIRRLVARTCVRASTSSCDEPGVWWPGVELRLTLLRWELLWSSLCCWIKVTCCQCDYASLLLATCCIGLAGRRLASLLHNPLLTHWRCSSSFLFSTSITVTRVNVSFQLSRQVTYW